MKFKRIPVDGFLLAMLAAIAAAAAAPRLGSHDGPLYVGPINSFFISFVFFLHGAALPLATLADGVRAVRVHALVLATTYGVFPLLGALLLALAGHALPDGLALGFFFLCAVSSTISSCVALTAVARGNVAAALFNAALSGVLGVVITPLYVGLVADRAGLGFSLPTAIADVALRVLLPLVAGQFARPLLGGWLGRHRRLVGIVDRGSIIMIVYGAFSDSILGGVWRQGAGGGVLLVVVFAVALFTVVSGFLKVASHALRLSREDAITAFYCGSQKSLANGLAVARVLFGGSPALGFIVLPLIVYHQVQLMVGVTLAKRDGLRDGSTR
jgi:sodium/bile acid cotransporter 7